MTAQRPTSRAQSPGPLSGRAIQRQVLARALQHPATLYPFATGVVAATYALFVAPFLGGAGAALLATGCAGLISAGSFGWQYLIQGERAATQMARQAIELEERRRRNLEKEDLEGRRHEVQRDVDQARWTDGREALDQLANQFDLLQSALDWREGLDPLAKARIARSATEAYRQGLGALSAASELALGIQAAEEHRLKDELSDLESELEKMDVAQRGSQAGIVKHQAIDLHKKRLDTLAQQSIDVERRLNEANSAAAALQRAHGTLSTLDSDVPDENVSDVATGLDRAVEQAVHARRSLAHDDPDRDDAGRESAR